jgi:DNA-binding transcriptional MerR regulator
MEEVEIYERRGCTGGGNMREEFPRIKSLKEGIEILFPYLTESQRRELEEGFIRALIELVGKEWGEEKMSEERIRKEIKDRMNEVIDKMEDIGEKESLKSKLNRFIELIPAKDLVRYTGKRMYDTFRKDILTMSAKIAFKKILKEIERKGSSEESSKKKEKIIRKIKEILEKENFSEEEIKDILKEVGFSEEEIENTPEEKKEEKKDEEDKEAEEIKREWENLKERMDKAADFSIRGVDALKHIIVGNMNRMIRKDLSMYISSLLGNPLRELYYRVRRGEEI